MDEVNKNIVNNILTKIPSHIKPIDFLMEVLEISKESCYRRIRGEIAFSIEDLIKLSKVLRISFDEIFGKRGNTRVIIDFPEDMFQRPANSFLKAVPEVDICKSNATDIEAIVATSRIPFSLLVHFDSLLRFAFYRWMHLNCEDSLNFFYSDIKLPKEVEDVRATIKKCCEKNVKISYIVDRNTFASFIDVVMYYYMRKLLSKKDLLLIKEDLFGIIDLFEKTAQTGCFSETTKAFIYLSSTIIETSSSYFKYGDKVKSAIYLFAMEPIEINNEIICGFHKKWMDNAKKYSTMITLSNEILQAKFFNKQRTIIEKIDTVDYKSSI
jgi:hypothetical protein